MACKCKELEKQLDEMVVRLKAVEDWLDEFEQAAEEIEKELESAFGATEVTFIPDSSLFRDKSKDN